MPNPIPSLVQHAATATTGASPASVAVTLAATQIRSTLVAWVAQPGNVVITPPANWVSKTISNANITGQFAYLSGINNAGGLTTITFTLAGSNAGAILFVQEWANLNVLAPFPFVNDPITNQNTGSTSVSSTATTPPNTNLCWFGGIAWITGATLTAGNLPAMWSSLDAQQTSTTAATNINGTIYSATPGPVLPNPFAASLGGTLSLSEAWVTAYGFAVSGASAQAHGILDGSIPGMLAGEGAGYGVGG